MIMNRNEIIEYLKTPNCDELFTAADKVRNEYMGNEVYIRGIIEFSNFCCRNCFYCGLRADNNKTERYRMTPQEIINIVETIYSKGIRTVVLQSGDDFGYSRSDICNIISLIKNKFDIAITLSIGERKNDDYKAFRDAGADRYLIKFETSNRSLYEKLHPRQDFNRRLEILEILDSLGYQVGTGFMIGLPGETIEDIANNIILSKNIMPDMIGIGPFIPQKETPLGHCSNGSVINTLKAIALLRINLKYSHIPATTALASLDKNGLVKGLKCGANVIMPDFTPDTEKNKYRIYDNKQRITFDFAKDAISKADRSLSLSRGDSLKKKEAIYED
ncbi:[FeFe] hydrogenase H-cluster radical SAM maturase HydE [candidate division WOR-3 bacterium]|nr:[FeFe] hydrogenase H-cluster radical SAM maturase HydE [candidate division WOR-3 bacterium]